MQTAEVTSGLVTAFMTTRLDYCNSVLAGLPQFTIDPLQRAAVKLVAGIGTREHSTLISHPESTLASNQVPQYSQALRAHAPGASLSQPCVPVGLDDIRR